MALRDKIATLAQDLWNEAEEARAANSNTVAATLRDAANRMQDALGNDHFVESSKTWPEG